MSFITGLTEDLTKAWNGTVDAVGSAANATSNAAGGFWKWLTGDSKEVSQSDTAASPPLSKSPADDSTAAPVVNSAPVLDKDDHSKFSLTHLLALFRAEAMHHCENKAKVPYLKVKEAQEKNKDLTQLLQVLTAQSDNKGDFELKDENTKQLFAKARALGVEIPNQTKFTKSERDSAIRNLDYSLKVIGDDIRIGFNDAQEALQQRNTFYQELKTCWDKITEAVRKFIHALSPNG